MPLALAAPGSTDDPAFRARPDLGEQGLEKIAPGAPGWPGRTGCQAPLTGETRLAQRPLRCLGGASLTVRIQHGERSDDRMGWGDRRLAALLGPTAANPDPAHEGQHHRFLGRSHLGMQGVTQGRFRHLHWPANPSPSHPA